jgi:hypothetical protein
MLGDSVAKDGDDKDNNGDNREQGDDNTYDYRCRRLI